MSLLAVVQGRGVASLRGRQKWSTLNFINGHKRIAGKIRGAGRQSGEG
jgi:hypothetical protein